MKRALTLILGLLALLMTSSPAFANYGDGGPPVCGTSTAAPSAGGPLTLTIGNFHPHTLVSFSIDPSAPASGFRANLLAGRPSVESIGIGTVTSDSVGSASIDTTAPTTPGTYTVTATDALGLTASTSITVGLAVLPTGVTLPNTGGGAGAVTPVTPVGVPLPATGTDLVPGLRIGATALVVGLALAGAAKLRRRSRANSVV
jgi:hypothetical protein